MENIRAPRIGEKTNVASVTRRITEIDEDRIL